MRLYVAGNGKSKGSPGVDYHVAGARNRLISYAFLKDWAKEEFQFWIDSRPPEAHVWLDSGAFTAFTLGRTIDLGEYCDYIEANRDAIAAYAVLDVIGKPEETRRNLDAMRARRLDPVVIYHVFNPLEVLDDLLRDGAHYVALGGMMAASGARSEDAKARTEGGRRNSQRVVRDRLQVRLDACFDVIGRHWPVKIHGLGVLAQWALERYPFYSTDGSSAIVGAGMGRVMAFREEPVPDGGLFSADGWRAVTRREWDGRVADGVGRVQEEGDRSASAHQNRRVINIRAQLALERYVTKLWARRGVVWEE